MGGRRQTFDYALHNVCGGETRRVIQSVPQRRSIPRGYANQKSVEGRYVTRESGEISVVAFLRNRDWLARLETAGPRPKE